MKERPNLGTFPVPFALGEVKGSITTSSNSSESHKEKIINQAFKLHLEGNIEKAAKYYIYCINNNFNDPRVLGNFGIILQDLGKLKESEIYLRKAIKLKPDYVNAHVNLGNTLKALGKHKEAETSLLKAIEIKPDCANAYFNLASIVYDLGKLQDALKAYNKAFYYKPNVLAHIFNSKLFLSPIPCNKKQIYLERAQFRKQISLIKKDSGIALDNNFNFGNQTFYLAFHGQEDDKEILKELAISLSAIDGLIYNSFEKQKQIENYKKRNKIRLGVCSEFLYSHSIYNFFGNIIKDLASADIEVIIFRPPNSKHDEQSKSLDLVASKTINLPNNLQDGCRMILNESIDILLYPEIGMSNYTYLLSLSRLALVQVNALGHSNTSGSPNIDYAISCRDYDVEVSERHFSERTIRLSRLPVHYIKPKFKDINFNRSEYHIPEKAFLIGLPHTPFKYHPDFDFILDKILVEIPNSIFFCAEGTNEFDIEELKERWKSSTNLILKRTIFHPRVKLNHFLNILKGVDIILCPFYFGMGNTYYQAMSVGTPVVSYKQDIFRTRHPFAGYRQMGITNPPIANTPEEYISICKKLAFDDEYRENIGNQILSKSKDYLFNDKTIYQEYIHFFEASLEAAINESSLPNHWETNS